MSILNLCKIYWRNRSNGNTAAAYTQNSKVRRGHPPIDEALKDCCLIAQRLLYHHFINTYIRIGDIDGKLSGLIIHSNSRLC